MKKFLKKAFRFFYRSLVVIIIVCVLGGLLANGYVRVSTKDKIFTLDQISNLEDVDCILVLGCLVKPDGQPSHMLNDRLDAGILAYNRGIAPKMIMSGDHGTVEYDEVNTMKQYAINAGVPSEDIFMDHAGLSTYDSMYRAKEIFGAKKIVIISQEYHLYRSIYIAEKMGLEAYGIAADYRDYVGQTKRDIREILARAKDFVKCIYKPKAKYMGEIYDLKGSGDVTNDK